MNDWGLRLCLDRWRQIEWEGRQSPWNVFGRCVSSFDALKIGEFKSMYNTGEQKWIVVLMRLLRRSALALSCAWKLTSTFTNIFNWWFDRHAGGLMPCLSRRQLSLGVRSGIEKNQSQTWNGGFLPHCLSQQCPQSYQHYPFDPSQKTSMGVLLVACSWHPLFCPPLPFSFDHGQS